MAGTGAFLLVSAAAVFVAVHWSRLPDEAKLGLVVGLTGAALAGGHALSRKLPSTGSVVFHLGAFLMPVDLAGFNQRLGVGWRMHPLAPGATSSVSFFTLSRANRSPVLRWAASAGVVVLTGGVAAVTGVPAALTLAAAAVITQRLWPKAKEAVAWALVAGMAPVISLAVSSITDGRGVLTQLGFLGSRNLAF